jgi:hypothetical protein
MCRLAVWYRVINEARVYRQSVAMSQMIDFSGRWWEENGIR